MVDMLADNQTVSISWAVAQKMNSTSKNNIYVGTKRIINSHIVRKVTMWICGFADLRI